MRGGRGWSPRCSRSFTSINTGLSVNYSCCNGQDPEIHPTWVPQGSPALSSRRAMGHKQEVHHALEGESDVLIGVNSQ